MSIKVSIIIPYYKNHNLLLDCVNSIAHQITNNQDYEIIIINDNPNLELNKNKFFFKNIKIINNNINLGPGLSRNKGIRVSSGKYILFVDSDDLVKLNYIKTIFDYIKKYDFDILTFNSKFNISLIAKEKYYILKKLLTAEIDTSVIYSIFKKNLLVKNKIYFKSGVHEDILFLFLSYKKANKIKFSRSSIYIKNNVINSIVNKISKDRIKDYFQAYTDITAICKKDPFFKNKDLLNKYINTGQNGYFYDIINEIIKLENNISNINQLIKYSVNLSNDQFSLTNQLIVSKKNMFNKLFFKIYSDKSIFSLKDLRLLKRKNYKNGKKISKL